MQEGLPVLYSFVRCPYAIRARLALAHIKQAYIHREVDLKNKPNHMISLSPKATVPVLYWEDGRVIDESVDIVIWALTNHLPDGWLENSMVDADAEIQNLLQDLSKDFVPALMRIKYPERYADANRMQQEKDLINYLQKMDKKLKHEYSLGIKPSYADILIAPMIRQLRSAEKEWFEINASQRVGSWLAHWVDSESFKAIMEKRPPWQSGDESVIVSYP